MVGWGGGVPWTPAAPTGGPGWGEETGGGTGATIVGGGVFTTATCGGDGGVVGPGPGCLVGGWDTEGWRGGGPAVPWPGW
jgi:hypothetical protein